MYVYIKGCPAAGWGSCHPLCSGTQHQSEYISWTMSVWWHVPWKSICKLPLVVLMSDPMTRLRPLCVKLVVMSHLQGLHMWMRNGRFVRTSVSPPQVSCPKLLEELGWNVMMMFRALTLLGEFYFIVYFYFTRSIDWIELNILNENIEGWKKTVWVLTTPKECGIFAMVLLPGRFSSKCGPRPTTWPVVLYSQYRFI
jgi:hypothetical protein